MIDYDKLDPGIRDVVRAVNDSGWITIDSGDGVSKPPVGRDFDFPHVVAESSGHWTLQGEAGRLADCLNRKFGPGWFVDARYTTRDGKAILIAMKPGKRTSIKDECHLCRRPSSDHPGGVYCPVPETDQQHEHEWQGDGVVPRQHVRMAVQAARAEGRTEGARGIANAYDEMERGRCGSCRWWRRKGESRVGDCINTLVTAHNDTAFRGVVKDTGGWLVTGDRFGCVHWLSEDCPTCGEPRRPK